MLLRTGRACHFRCKNNVCSLQIIFFKTLTHPYSFFTYQKLQPYFTVNDGNIPLSQNKIVNGDRSIITVAQGFIGYCNDRGQPVLLPPGIHQWKSPTLTFETIHRFESTSNTAGTMDVVDHRSGLHGSDSRQWQANHSGRRIDVLIDASQLEV